jgi:hypothetical protein
MFWFSRCIELKTILLSNACFIETTTILCIYNRHWDPLGLPFDSIYSMNEIVLSYFEDNISGKIKLGLFIVETTFQN